MRRFISTIVIFMLAAFVQCRAYAGDPSPIKITPSVELERMTGLAHRIINNSDNIFSEIAL